MISILTYGFNEEEIELLCYISKDLIAKYWDERLDFLSVKLLEELENLDMDNLDIAFVDITQKGGIEFAKMIRQAYEMIEIVLIADVTISPVLYLTPSIRAATLFLKPLQQEVIQEGMEDVFQLLKRESQDDKNCMIIKDKEETVRVLYSQISYLEARNKRIYIRVRNKEYSIYGVLDSVQDELPEEFKRCHRSFIVNTKHVKKIRFAKNTIELIDDMEIPLSRSYKADFKEVVRDEF